MTNLMRKIEEAFDEKFGTFVGKSPLGGEYRTSTIFSQTYDYQKVKSFILTDVMNMVVEMVEEMKRPHDECYLDKCYACGATDGYNAALNDITKALKVENPLA